MAAEVVSQIVVLGKTVGRNPNCSAVEPPLRKAAGRYMQAGDDRASDNKVENRTLRHHDKE